MGVLMLWCAPHTIVFTVYSGILSRNVCVSLVQFEFVERGDDSSDRELLQRVYNQLVRTMGGMLAVNRVAYSGILIRNVCVSLVKFEFVERER